MAWAPTNWSTKLGIVALCGGLIACTAIKNAVDPSQPGSFYDPPSPLPPGPPGTLIRTEPLPHPPAGSKAYKILYKSRNIHGGDIAVSGVAIIPDAPAPPEGRPVVAWAHPTTGIARRCAPSLSSDPFRSIEGTDLFITLQGSATTGDPAKVEPWKGLLEKNSTGVKGIDVPVFIAQGTKDTVVVPEVTQAYAKRLCDAGVTVELKMYVGGTHVPMGKDAAPDVSDWVRARFDGTPATSTCKKIATESVKSAAAEPDGD